MDKQYFASLLTVLKMARYRHIDFAPVYGNENEGAFGCATLLDKSLPIEEGDARYMPSEILNEKHDDLDKADIFSLGVAMYEPIRGSPLPEEGPQTLNLKKGKLPLLPGHSLQLQNLLKAMLDPNPVCRPSAKELVENLMFHRVLKNVWAWDNHDCELKRLGYIVL